MLCKFQKKFLKDRKNCYVPSFSKCLAPGQTNLCAESPPISIVSRLNRMRNFNGGHFFHTRLFPYCSNAWFPEYCGKRALHSLEKSWEVTQHRVYSCGRHLGKFDDVTIYPVLVVARTVRQEEFIQNGEMEVTLKAQNADHSCPVSVCSTERDLEI